MIFYMDTIRGLIFVVGIIEIIVGVIFTLDTNDPNVVLMTGWVVLRTFALVAVSMMVESFTRWKYRRQQKRQQTKDAIKPVHGFLPPNPAPARVNRPLTSRIKKMLLDKMYDVKTGKESEKVVEDE